eukprot:456-Pyramimonas_sp.AAC.1
MERQAKEFRGKLIQEDLECLQQPHDTEHDRTPAAHELLLRAGSDPAGWISACRQTAQVFERRHAGRPGWAIWQREIRQACKVAAAPPPET